MTEYEINRMYELEDEQSDLEEQITRLDWQIEDAEEAGDTEKADELDAEREYLQVCLDEVTEELDALREKEWQLDNAPAWAW